MVHARFHHLSRVQQICRRLVFVASTSGGTHLGIVACDVDRLVIDVGDKTMLTDNACVGMVVQFGWMFIAVGNCSKVGDSNITDGYGNKLQLKSVLGGLPLEGSVAPIGGCGCLATLIHFVSLC
jgi:hypothetical protein